MAIGLIEGAIGLAQFVFDLVTLFTTQWGTTSALFWRNLTAGLGLLVIVLGSLYFFSGTLAPLAAILVGVSAAIFFISFLFWIISIFRDNAGSGESD